MHAQLQLTQAAILEAHSQVLVILESLHIQYASPFVCSANNMLQIKLAGLCRLSLTVRQALSGIAMPPKKNPIADFLEEGTQEEAAEEQTEEGAEEEEDANNADDDAWAEGEKILAEALAAEQGVNVKGKR